MALLLFKRVSLKCVNKTLIRIIIIILIDANAIDAERIFKRPRFFKYRRHFWLDILFKPFNMSLLTADMLHAA